MKSIIIILCLCVIGCDNPYIDPNVSKAVTEKKQLEQLEKQTVVLERIAIALENFQMSQTVNYINDDEG